MRCVKGARKGKRMEKSKAEKLASFVFAEYQEMHAGRRAWNKNYGQWLVYGWEEFLGFMGGVDLCRVINQEHNKENGDVLKRATEFFEKEEWK